MQDISGSCAEGKVSLEIRLQGREQSSSHTANYSVDQSQRLFIEGGTFLSHSINGSWRANYLCLSAAIVVWQQQF